MPILHERRLRRRRKGRAVPACFSRERTDFMLEFKTVSVEHAETGRPLLRDFSFTLRPGDRAALIGEEGNGKSTLLKLVSEPASVRAYCKVTGHIDLHGGLPGYLPQRPDEALLQTPVYEFFPDGPDYGLLPQMGIPVELPFSDRPLASFSGGERIKLLLLRTLMAQPDFLLLDEPTNDIDLPTLDWLERFILASKAPVLFVSHDETLLERTANVILHVEQVHRKTAAQHTIERMDYRAYVARRQGALRRQEQIASRQRADQRAKEERWRQVFQRVEHEQNAISRANPAGGRLLKKKMHAVKSQQKRMERETEAFLDFPDPEEAVDLFFDKELRFPNGKEVFSLTLPRLQAGDRLLAKNLALTLTGPAHAALVGDNGVGKSTLLREIWSSLRQRTDIRAGYMPQDYLALLDGQKTPIETLWDGGDRAALTLARTRLGSMKFTADEMEQPVSALSGGQQAKLCLLRLLLGGCNVLLLDEPTRNLSPLSGPVLREALRNYGGAFLCVTHDRKLLTEVCTQVFRLTERGLERQQM